MRFTTDTSGTIHAIRLPGAGIFINILYSYVRLVLIDILLVRTLAVWRMRREEKKANRNAAET